MFAAMRIRPNRSFMNFMKCTYGVATVNYSEEPIRRRTRCQYMKRAETAGVIAGHMNESKY